jgi:hypothetical protein
VTLPAAGLAATSGCGVRVTTATYTAAESTVTHGSGEQDSSELLNQPEAQIAGGSMQRLGAVGQHASGSSINEARRNSTQAATAAVHHLQQQVFVAAKVAGGCLATNPSACLHARHTSRGSCAGPGLHLMISLPHCLGCAHPTYRQHALYALLHTLAGCVSLHHRHTHQLTI